ncbi:hypothetical protein E2562_036258 [Oryza meyeriana var. granulata]|uniref:Phytocyanin domain-containing protein n=1 Tax=Oryza meyeriana var. granulata TaxID=110450 RepID=A0A6G1CCG3_9ORYZ|nr:hypothetical protein E2562_036258 [Oryza meyeriana var. granulata]
MSVSFAGGKFDDGSTVFKFDRSGPFFFISGNEANYRAGEKLIVVVMADRSGHHSPPLAPLPASVSPPPGTEGANSTTPAPPVANDWSGAAPVVAGVIFFLSVSTYVDYKAIERRAEIGVRVFAAPLAAVTVFMLFLVLQHRRRYWTLRQHYAPAKQLIKGVLALLLDFLVLLWFLLNWVSNVALYENTKQMQ